MNAEGKPIPLPRKTTKNQSTNNLPQIVERLSSSSSSPPTASNRNSWSVPIPDDNSNVPCRPVPLPRKLLKPRLKNPVEKEIKKEDEDDDDKPLPACFFEPKQPSLSDDPNRKTINIFKRKENPFGTDFETSLQDAPTIITIESSVEAGSERWTKFSSDSTEDDCDDFVGDNNGNILQSDSSPENIVSTVLTSKNDPAVFSGFSTCKRLEKIKSCPGAPEISALSSSREQEPYETEANEPIYEPIFESGMSDLPELNTPSIKHAGSVQTFGNSSLQLEPGSLESTSSLSAANDSSHNYQSEIDRDVSLRNSSSSSYASSKRRTYILGADVENEPSPEAIPHFSIGQQDEIRGARSYSPGNRLTRSLEAKSGKANEYDEVAIEDGNIVIRRSSYSVTPPNGSDISTTTSTSEHSCSSLRSRDSLVREFDPLCQSPGDEIPSYEDIDESPEESSVESGNMDVTLNPNLSFQNLEYYSGNKGEVNEFQRNKDAESVSNISSNVEEEYEPVSPLNDSMSSVKVTDSPVQNTFLRRVSKKFGLNPIREEPPISRGTDSVSSVISRCAKCYEEHAENMRCKFSPVPRENIRYSSVLFKPTGISKRDFTKRWAVLSNGKLTFYSKPGESKIDNSVGLERVVMISKKDDQRASHGAHDLKCFQLYLGNGKHSTMVLAGSSESDRSAWMQKYVEAFTSSFPTNIISSYDRSGWCFMKESVTGSWRPCWFILSERRLIYSFNDCDEYSQLDLRKVRGITLSPKEGEARSTYVDNHEVLTIDMINKILDVQTESVKLTSKWEQAIRSAALFNGPTFDEMQLTNNNVPVVVDKCITFLYAHGLLAEGIYRQSGANSRIAGLLDEFKKDAWAVQISQKDYSAHDVAGTLKRFFRTLPEPLVTDKLYPQWISAYGTLDKKTKLEKYSKLLEELPEINYNILRNLICHLYSVHEFHEKNLMPLDNLSPIWGPTLMNVDSNVENTSKLAQSYEIACAQCGVVRDLIENFHVLFRVDPQEIAKEARFQEGLAKFVSGQSRKSSGDMRIYVYVHERDESTAISITLTPTATAASVVDRISNYCTSQPQLRNYDNLSLHEVICSKSLERPLYPAEKVIETILRWSIWDAEERKSNYLILKKNTLYPALVPYAKVPTPVYGEFKYADSKSKSFRKYWFEFSGAKLKYFKTKDPKTLAETESWNIEDIVWYIGHEPKRTSPTRWNFTFTPRSYQFKRSKEEPYFGNIVCVNAEDDLYKFIAAMIVGEHPDGLYPTSVIL